MSSHRGTGDPEGSGCRQHRHLRLRQPGPARHGHDHHELHPVEDLGRRPQLLRIRRRRPVPDQQHRQRQRRQAEITYEFEFTTRNTNPNTFLYNTGPIDRIDSPNFNRKQTYDVHEVRGRRRRRLGHDLLSPPCNVGLRIDTELPGARQRGDLRRGRWHQGVRRSAPRRVLRRSRVDLRPRCAASVPEPAPDSTPAALGINALRAFNVYTLAIQIPISRLTSDGSQPTDPLASNATIGVYGAAYRRKATLARTARPPASAYVQVSRLGNLLFNEVIVRSPQGGMERRAARSGQGLRAVRQAAGARNAAAAPLPRRVLEPGRPQR